MKSHLLLLWCNSLVGGNESAKKKIEMLEQECYERGKAIRAREEQIEKLKTKIKKMKKEKEEMGSTKNDRQGPESATKSEIEVLRQQLAAFKSGKRESDVIKSQEEEITKLKQELTEYKRANETLTQLKTEKEDLKSEIVRLRDELEQRQVPESAYKERSVSFVIFQTYNPVFWLYISIRWYLSSNEARRDGKEDVVSLKREVEMLNFVISAIYGYKAMSFEGSMPVGASAIVKAISRWQVFEAGKERPEFVALVVDAIESSAEVCEGLPWNVLF